MLACAPKSYVPSIQYMVSGVHRSLDWRCILRAHGFAPDPRGQSRQTAPQSPCRSFLRTLDAPVKKSLDHRGLFQRACRAPRTRGGEPEGPLSNKEARLVQRKLRAIVWHAAIYGFWPGMVWYCMVWLCLCLLLVLRLMPMLRL